MQNQMPKSNHIVRNRRSPATRLGLEALEDRFVPTALSEIMFSPSSSDPTWEWIEVYNENSFSVDIEGFFLDDDDGALLSDSNVQSGQVPAGGFAVLYNADAVSADEFADAWGAGIELIGVTDWPELDDDGDRIGLWDSAQDYLGRDFANAVEDIEYDDASPWPEPDGMGSIFHTALTTDNQQGQNWAGSRVGVAGGFESSATDGTTPNSGADIGSPGQGPSDNSPPEPEDDQAAAVEDTSGVTIDVLANDSDPDGDTLTLQSLGEPSNGGTVEIINGLVFYTPASNFNGTENFTYQIADDIGAIADGLVTVEVESVNDEPSAVDDSFTATGDGGATSLDVLANDTDPDEDTLEILAVSTPSDGGTAVRSGNSIEYTPPPGFVGVETFTYGLTDGNGGSDVATVTVEVTASEPSAPFNQNEVASFAVSTATGGEILLYTDLDADPSTLTPIQGAPGGVRAAAADLTEDGVADLVVGTGPGVAPQVLILDGETEQTVRTVDAFEASFLGGVFVAAGDINGDGVPEIAISPDEGGGPRVRIFDGVTGDQVIDFFGIDDPAFRGGARVAFADLNGDEVQDLIVAAGFGGGPRLAIYNGAGLAAGGEASSVKFRPDFFVFEDSLRNGVFVTGGDLTGDGMDDLIVAAGPGGGPRVQGFSGSDLINGDEVTVVNFFAGDDANRGGTRVAAKDLNGDELIDLLTAPGEGAAPLVTAYSGDGVTPEQAPAILDQFSVFTPDLTEGLFVG